MNRLFIPWAAVAMLLGLLAIPAHAAPLGGIDAGGALADKSLVQHTHGWHRYCAWDRRGYHRHVPGVGRVRCGRYRPYYYGYYGYDVPYIAPYSYRRWRGGGVRRHVYRPRAFGRIDGGGIRRGGRGFRGGFGGGRRGGGGRRR